MGFMERMMAKGMIKTVRAGMQNASDQKLMSHVDTALQVISNTDDIEVQGMLGELISDIRGEIRRRGMDF